LGIDDEGKALEISTFRGRLGQIEKLHFYGLASERNIINKTSSEFNNRFLPMVEMTAL
jgi:hypothetical protein